MSWPALVIQHEEPTPPGLILTWLRDRGADIVRVHDVRENVRAARMTDAIVRGSGVPARPGSAP